MFDKKSLLLVVIGMLGLCAGIRQLIRVAIAEEHNKLF